MRARVWNDGQAEYTEEFQGQVIKIPSKAFILMDAKDANNFRGQYTPIIRDAQGRDLRPKQLRVEVLHDETPVVEKPEIFMCQMDGSVWPSQDALDSHIAKNFADRLIEPEAKERLTKKGQKQK